MVTLHTREVLVVVVVVVVVVRVFLHTLHAF